MGRIWIALCAVVVGGAVLVTAPFAHSVSATADSFGLVDPATGIWHLYEGGVQSTEFYFGDPGDYPFMGDWNCNTIDTPGLYRQSDGYVYLRNKNTQGTADVSFFFGDPGDVPIAGDFNGDGCDTVSIYRPSNQTFYIINKLGTKDGGLGAADYSYVFGDPGDQPFVGDYNGDGTDTPGLHRATTGLVYYRNTNTTGVAHNTFIFGDPGDRFVTGDWTANGMDSPGVFRPSNTTMYLRYENSQGNADASWVVGSAGWLPVAGVFAMAAPPPTVPPGTPGAIAGTVTEKGTGTPLAGITVEAKKAGTGYFVAGDVTANDGTYEVDGLDPRDYDVYFEDHSNTYVDKSVSVTVKAGVTKTVNVEMVSWAVANQGKIRGTVTEEGTGTPLGGITVEVKDEGTGFFVSGDTTASNGTYEVDGLDPDDYDVYFEDHSGVYVDGSETNVTVNPGSATTVDAVLIRWAIANCRAQSSIPAAECEALVAFYDATDGPNWTDDTDWLEAFDPCSWYGVTCSGGAVHELRLTANGLLGGIPSALLSLTDLAVLSLDSNGLSGEIPSALGGLTDLTDLDLGGNGLSGEIPSALGSLTDLTWLSLSHNGLSGEIPSALGSLTDLTWLFLNDNGLSGPVPPELQNLSYLVHLELSGQAGCLTASTPGLAAWLAGFDASWNDGCPVP